MEKCLEEQNQKPDSHCALLTIGVFAGVFSMAAINSSIVQRIDAAVNEELSHIQVNNKDFRSSSDIRNFITDPWQ